MTFHQGGGSDAVRPRPGFRVPFSAALLVCALPLLLLAHGGGDDDDDDDDFHDGGGRPPPDCLSSDPVSSPGCYKHRSDGEIFILLRGSTANPFPLPRVSGEVVETPSEVRTILRGGGSSPCKRFRRDALTSLFNIRRSILFGDRLLGEDGARCFGVAPFCIVLRCGSVFVPDPSTPDPSDARKVTERTPLLELVLLANQLSELAACPSTNGAPCGKTIGELASILNQVNDSDIRRGECGFCRDDDSPPVITCPAGTLEIECQGPRGAPIQYEVAVSDDCDASPHVSCYPPPGTVLLTGTTKTVICKAKDDAGNEARCSFKVRVVDTKPPVISCPESPIVVDCAPGGAPGGAVVNYPPPVVTDLCDEYPAVTCQPPSGSFFPSGTTTVTCTATDSSGNTATCAFDVIVVEDTPAALICPGDIVVECRGPGGTIVEFPPPMVSATCDDPGPATCDPPSGSMFPVGETVVTCRAADARGNPIACSFKVTVEDTTPPAITCPGDVTAECAGPDGTPVTFEAIADDACDEHPTLVCEPPPGTSFPPGETVITCTATDESGNAASCSFKVIVEDTRPPEISCPEGPIRVDCLTGGGAVVDYPAPVVSDGCDALPALTCTPPPGSFFPIGRTTVTCIARDGAGNESSCAFDVEVADVAAPSLVCVDGIVVECAGPGGAVVTYPTPTVADACDGSPVVTCVPPSGSLFPIGTTTVVCTARDTTGHTMECRFDVTVEDTRPPEIVCPTDRVVECETPEGTRVEFAVTATDPCDPAPVVTCDPPSGSFFAPGLTVVECTATDSFGNRTVCRFDVSVVDTRPPIITCPESLVLECQSPEGTPATYEVSAIDACGAPVTLACEPPPGALLPPGVTRVECAATDEAGNRSTCSFDVTVRDTTPPGITCPTEVVSIECTGEGSARAAYPVPAAVDACDPAIDIVCDPPPDTLLPLGTHLVTCTATDGSGNTASCSFQLRVVDTAPPSLNCVEDIVRECEGPEGARVEYEDPTPADTCDPAPNLSCLPASGSLFLPGETTVTCTADDREGNLVACSFTVTVADTMPPLIQCPSDLAVSCASDGGAVVSYTVTATDHCDPNPIVTCDPPSGHRFPAGTTAVTCTARDLAGNTAECTFLVTVRDDAPPAIVCPESFERTCSDDGTAVVEYPAPQVTDACDPAPRVTCEPPSGTMLPPGTHVISCTARDAAGNEASCELTVTVLDIAPPVLVCPPDMTVECDGPDGAAVDYPTPVASDACDAEPAVMCVPPSGSRFATGQTEVVCTSRDAAGNTVECTFTVTVRDTIPPEIDCSEPIAAEAQSPEGAVVDYAVPALDACDPSLEVVCEPPPGSLFPIGQTTVTCRASDSSSGAEASCTFTVTVVDRTPPLVQCSPDLVFEGTTSGSPPHKPPGWPPGSNPPANAITAIIAYDAPLVTDSGQTQPIQTVCTPPTESRLPLGTHTITCRAIDLAGNEATCSFEVEVVLGATAFIRGDVNVDSNIDIADPIALVNHLFLSGPVPKCFDSADVNDDGAINLTDVINELNYIFQGMAPPPPPFLPLCGLEAETDALECDRYLPCE